MITSFHIENFKGIRKLELENLSRITLLGGRNNVGKTTVLEGVAAVHHFHDPGEFLRQIQARGVPIKEIKPEVVWAPVFHGYEEMTPIRFTIHRGNTEESVVISYNPSDARQVVQPSLWAEDENDLVSSVTVFALDIAYHMKGQPTKSLRHIIDGNRIVAVPRYFVFQPISAYLSARSLPDQNEIATMFSKLDVRGENDELVKHLQVLEPRLKSLSSLMVGGSVLIHGDIGTGRKIPISYMGDGISRLLTIIMNIMTSKNGIVLIDEIENGIHHSVMPKVWEGIARAAAAHNCQVIATTHSYECLQAAHDGLEDAGLQDELTYVRLDRAGDEVKAKTFDHKILGMALEAGLEVR